MSLKVRLATAVYEIDNGSKRPVRVRLTYKTGVQPDGETFPLVVGYVDGSKHACYPQVNDTPEDQCATVLRQTKDHLEWLAKGLAPLVTPDSTRWAS